MQTQVTKKIDFSGKNLYIGLDVHKKSWHVTILCQQMSLKSFSQPPTPEALYLFLNSNYPGANFYSAYEAGFCGYSHHRELNKLGIHNIVINPADVPKSNKDSHQKNDKSDSRLIAEALRGDLLKEIYVFDTDSEEFRGMFRARLALAKDIRRTKVRIKGFLLYRNIEIPASVDNPNSLAYSNWLKQLEFEDKKAKIQLSLLLDRLLFLKEQKRQFEQQLKDTARYRDKELFNLLQTIPGIGPITALGIMAEIGNIKRFKNIKNFASYVGLIPRIKQSGEKEQTGNITYRHNKYLRPLLVEAAWQAVRSDPAMLQYYQDSCLKGNAKKAIIKVARKLLSKIMFVMRNRIKYERGIL
jgi:transposase